MILLPSSASSQGFSKETDILIFSFEAGMKILEMKLRNDHLENQFLEYRLKFDQLENEIKLKDQKIVNKDIQIALLNNTVQNYRDLYNMEKDNEPGFFNRLSGTLKDLGIYTILVSAGIIIGKLFL